MLWVCKGCTCHYSVGAARCPECGQSEHWDSSEYEEIIMGKITRHGGATDAVTGQGFESADDATAAALEREHDGSATALPPADGQDGEELDAEPESVYAGWTKDDLSAEAEQRGLPKSGTKAELLERLEADDAAREGRE